MNLRGKIIQAILMELDNQELLDPALSAALEGPNDYYVEGVLDLDILTGRILEAIGQGEYAAEVQKLIGATGQ